MISLPYGDQHLRFEVPAANLLAVASPNPVQPCSDPTAEILRALAEPVGAPRLREAARGAQKVVIAADDMTRLTPVEQILPLLLDELNLAGVRDEQVTVLVALGTHRPMTAAEIRAHFGEAVTRRVQVLNNPWNDPAAMASLGVTPNGTPVSVCRLALEADFLIGVGSIVPHHIPGFSGGAKIIQPGISGPAATGATHFLSTRAPRSYLGQVENPVRAEIESIARQVGLKAIFNVVLDPAGRLVRAFYGDFILAHRAGVAVSRQVYGVALPGLADIVIAGSHPCDIEFWQAHKSLYPAELAVKEGGTIIVVTPCPEGVSVTHGDMLAITALDAAEIERRILDGQVADVVSGALALAWAKTRQRASVSLVSGGISAADARRLGFTPFETVEAALADALDAAMRKEPKGSNKQPQAAAASLATAAPAAAAPATVTVLTHAPDTLPLLPG